MKTIMILYTNKDLFGNINIWYHICFSKQHGGEAKQILAPLIN